jgi:hypothetical protein
MTRGRRKIFPPLSGDYVVIEWRYAITEQTAEFQSLRMRMFNVRGHCPRHMKGNSFMVLKSLSLTVHRLRSKAFSLVCLSRLPEILPIVPLGQNLQRGEGNFSEEGNSIAVQEDMTKFLKSGPQIKDS